MCEWAGGVEIFPDAAEQARKKGIDMVEEGDIEALALPIAPGSLDVILCLDVLEHLVDPWIAVRKLHTFLKPGGVMIASLPNVRNLKVIVPLIIFGDWKYTKEGLLDKTHLRFFTRKTAMELMECSGLKVDKVPTFFQRGSKAAIVNTLTFSLFKNFLQFQYLVRAAN